LREKLIDSFIPGEVVRKLKHAMKAEKKNNDNPQPLIEESKANSFQFPLDKAFAILRCLSLSGNILTA
jgi:hypothetical protein